MALNKLKLERVFGLTSQSNAQLAIDSKSGQIVYLAGSSAVLYDSAYNRQKHVINVTGRKALTCVAISPCGRYLATGETGHEPCVRIWDVATKQQLQECKGHAFGITCVEFTPDNRYVISIGNQHDMTVFVWDYKRGTRVGCNKVASKVRAMCFNEQGDCFVTVGAKHVKFWSLESSTGVSHSSSMTNIRAAINTPDAVPLKGRSGILEQHRSNMFTSVVCGKGQHADQTYALAQSGILCEFDVRRKISRWVDVKSTAGHAIDCDNYHLYVACADGIVRLFDVDTLKYVNSLPKPHYLGVDVALGHTIEHMVNTPSKAHHPHVVAMRAWCDNIYGQAKCTRLTCIYSDHSIYQWDTSETPRFGKSASHLFHNGPIFTLDVYDTKHQAQCLPPGTIITGGQDETIRFWRVLDEGENQVTPRNIYSMELLKIIYAGNDVQSLNDHEAMQENASGLTRSVSDLTASNLNLSMTSSVNQNRGIKCLRISPDGKHLASGDKNGLVRIHSLRTFDVLTCHAAHDSDVSCIEFSDSAKTPFLLASGSRDRLIHIYSVTDNYRPVSTLDDHTSAISGIQFTTTGDNVLTLLTSASDKAIIVWRHAKEVNEAAFTRVASINVGASLYGMHLGFSGKTVYVACGQDRQIRSYDIVTTKLRKTIKASIADDGQLQSIALDPWSGRFALTSTSGEKVVNIVNLATGEILSTAFGHSESISRCVFVDQGRYILTISCDGCMFMWRVASDIYKSMQAAREKAQSMKDSESLTNSTVDDLESYSSLDEPVPKAKSRHIDSDDEALPPSDLSSRGQHDGTSPPVTDVHLNNGTKSETLYVPEPARPDVGQNFHVEQRDDVFNNRSQINEDISIRSDSLMGRFSLHMTPASHELEVRTSTPKNQRRQWGAPQELSPVDANDPAASTALELLRGSNPNLFISASMPQQESPSTFQRGTWQRSSKKTNKSKGLAPAPPLDDCDIDTSNRNVQPTSRIERSQTESPIWTPTVRQPHGTGTLNRRRTSNMSDLPNVPEHQDANNNDSFVSSVILRNKKGRMYNRITRRRQTMPELFVDGSEARKDDTDLYEQSDLQSRTSRPISPASALFDRKESIDSNYLTPASRNRPTSSFSSYLAGPPKYEFGASTMLNDTRNRLRKSQENLNATYDLDGNNDTPYSMNRSRSFAALHQQNRAPSSLYLERDREGQIGLRSAREMARSHGNVNQLQNIDRSASRRNLADTLRELKRASQTDLNKVGQESNGRDQSPMLDRNQFYERSSSTLPRRGKSGAVKKKIDAHRRYGQESEDSSDNYSSRNSAAPNRLISTLRRNYETQRLSEMSSDMESPGSRYGRTQSTQSSYLNPPVKNYLAQKLLAHKQGHNEEAQTPRRSTADLSAFADSQAQQMARHVGQCKRDLQTSFDAAMHAYNMVQNDDTLNAEDRYILQKDLSTQFNLLGKRLNAITMESGEVESNVTTMRSSTATRSDSGMTSDVLNAALAQYMQQYSDDIARMVLQKMQTNDDK